MIKAVKKLVPKSLKLFYKLQRSKKSVLTDFIYDYKRYVRFSGTAALNKQDHMKAFLIKEYHAIEKGLALRHPKPGFGTARISRLIDVLKTYLDKFNADATTDITLSALEQYLDFNNGFNIDSSSNLDEIRKLLAKNKDRSSDNLGGIKSVSRSDIFSAVNFDYSNFVKSRFSTRDFSDVKVSNDLLLQAIDDARYTPSVCNRQAWKVYVVDSDNSLLRDKFLSVQNGNRGFGEYISSLLVITGKLSSFFDYERNQVFVDGGMFSMSLLLALHAKGLGTCCLNTSYTAERNEEFKKVIDIDEDSVPIMFIAVGHLKESYNVAISQRKPIDEIVTIL